MLGFKFNDVIANTEMLQKMFMQSFSTLIHRVDSSCGTPVVAEHVYQCILILRICSNIMHTQNGYIDAMLHNWFIASNRSITLFLNAFIAMIRAEGLSIQEICEFIGTVLRSSLNEESVAYLESDGMFTRVDVNV